LGASRSIPRRWKKAPNEPASIATADIAYACRNTSSTRAGVEIGFGSWEETVRSCVLVQKTESPKRLDLRAGCVSLEREYENARDRVEDDRRRRTGR